MKYNEILMNDYTMGRHKILDNNKLYGKYESSSNLTDLV